MVLAQVHLHWHQRQHCSCVAPVLLIPITTVVHAQVVFLLSVCVDCSIKQRAIVLKDGLSDRDANVQEAAVKVLLHWYETDCGKDALRLLQLLDVETYAGGCSSRQQLQPATSSGAMMQH